MRVCGKDLKGLKLGRRGRESSHAAERQQMSKADGRCRGPVRGLLTTPLLVKKLNNDDAGLRVEAYTYRSPSAISYTHGTMNFKKPARQASHMTEASSRESGR